MQSSKRSHAKPLAMQKWQLSGERCVCVWRHLLQLKRVQFFVVVRTWIGVSMHIINRLTWTITQIAQRSSHLRFLLVSIFWFFCVFLLLLFLFLFNSNAHENRNENIQNRNETKPLKWHLKSFIIIFQLDFYFAIKLAGFSAFDSITSFHRCASNCWCGVHFSHIL